MAEPSRFPPPAVPGSPGHRDAARGVQIIALVLAAVITIADYLTGPYLAFATFYLVPVAIMAWYAPRVRALVFSVLVTLASVVVRSLNPGVVGSAIELANGVLRLVLFVFAVLLIEAEHSARVRVLKLSTTDALTGTLNRRAFTELGRDRLLHAARRGTPVTLVYLDLDDLKSRNDRFGHDAGDGMITAFADAMKRTFRAIDLVTRIGGDEFCCLLTDTDEDEAQTVLARFGEVVSQVEPVPMSASIGAVTIVPTAETTIADLIHEADVLMYQAKLAGKGQHRTRTLAPPPSDRTPRPGTG